MKFIYWLTISTSSLNGMDIWAKSFGLKSDQMKRLSKVVSLNKAAIPSLPALSLPRL